MKCRRGIAIAILGVTLQGCFSSTVVLHVRADGSGTATITAYHNPAAMKEFDQGLGAAPGDATPGKDPLPVPSASALNEFFGTPVRLVGSTLQPGAKGPTRTTDIAFDDVRALRIPFPPVVPGALGSDTHMSWASTGIPTIRFSIRPHENGDRLLIVTMPEEMPFSRGERTIEPKPGPAQEEAQRKEQE